MRRVFWLALGATAGVLVVRRLTRVLDAVTPAGMARGVGGLGDRFGAFAAEVRAGALEREVELRSALGLDGRHDVVDVHTSAGSPAGGRPGEVG